MIVINKTEGTKISYSVRGSKLTLGEELTVDIAKYERDFAVHLDFCHNQLGLLTMGTAERYVAQVDIPDRKYTYIENGVDEDGATIMDKQPVPLDMGEVTLTLWGV